MSEINITHLSYDDRLKLLKLLWENQIPAAFFAMSGLQSPPFEEKYGVICTYLDYYCGRAIKCRLKDDIINTCGYDRDAGEGTFARLVATFDKK